MINTSKFAVACSLCAGILWIMCSFLVLLSPNFMLEMTAHMIHIELTEMQWTLTWSGFFLGLLSWMFFTGFAGALLAVIYNRLVSVSNIERQVGLNE